MSFLALGCEASCTGAPSSAPCGGTFPLEGGRLTPQSAYGGQLPFQGSQKTGAPL